MTSVLIVDDHQMFGEAMAALLSGEADIDLVEVVASAEEAIERVATTCFDVVVMDVDLPGMSGISALGTVKERCAETAVVVVTALRQTDLAAQAFREGANAFVEKHRAADDLMRTIRAVATGEIVVPAEAFRDAIDHVLPPPPARDHGLTEREIDVLQALAEGKSTNEVAAHLFISPRTVQSHVQNTIDKMGVRSKLEAVLTALRDGVVRLPDRD